MDSNQSNAPQKILSRRAFLQLTLKSALTTVVAGTGGALYASKVEPDWLEVNQVRLTLPRLAPALHGYRLLQISDIHMDGWMTRARLMHIVEIVNEQQPDTVAITGDFVTYDPAEAYAADLIAALSQLKPRHATVAVLGNHDYWTNAAVIREVIRDSGIVDLNNDVFSVQDGNGVLHFAGVDDIWEKHARLDTVLDKLPADGAAILLAHEPDFADTTAKAGRFDLQISGHSHGGQIVLPLLGPPVLPYLARKYPLGRYQVGNMLQYTNRGLGMVSPQVRFNCRPEITVFILETGSA